MIHTTHIKCTHSTNLLVYELFCTMICDIKFRMEHGDLNSYGIIIVGSKLHEKSTIVSGRYSYMLYSHEVIIIQLATNEN